MNRKNKLTPSQALQKLIQKAVTQAALARLLGVTHPSIHGMIKRGQVSLHCVNRAHTICDGEISLNEFRPDIFKE